MTNINELEFTCPHCGRRHKLLEWVSRLKLDDEWIWENLSEDGIVRLSVPYVRCECNAEYIVDISQGYVAVYDDRGELVYDAGFRCGSS